MAPRDSVRQELLSGANPTNPYHPDYPKCRSTNVMNRARGGPADERENQCDGDEHAGIVNCDIGRNNSHIAS